MLKAVGRFLTALNGNAGKSQIALGVAWGILLGLVPIGNFFWIVFFIFSFFFNHNHIVKIIVMILMIILSSVTAPLLDLVGWQILHAESLLPLFTTMYNMPFVPFTKFNNTLVMGGVICGLALFIPVFAGFMFLIPLYRNKLSPKLRELKFVKKLTGSSVIKSIDKNLFK